MDDPIIIKREQDTDLQTYPEVKVARKPGEMLTLGNVIERYAHQLNLSGNMTFLVNGVPSDRSRVLEAGDMVFCKGTLKERGVRS